MEDTKELKRAWANYKTYLKNKYPSKKGKDFEFSCPYHRILDSIIEKIKE